MGFSTNQIVWAKSLVAGWQPAFVIDVTNETWLRWNQSLPPLSPLHRHCFIIANKSIELLREDDAIRDFCVGYAEHEKAVASDSDAANALPLLVQMAAILSGEDVTANWDWQHWARNSIANCEPIRVSKKFYEKFTKQTKKALTPPMRNSPSPSPDDPVENNSNDAPSTITDDSAVSSAIAVADSPARRSTRARKTIKGSGVKKQSDKSGTADDAPIFLPVVEPELTDETKNELRVGQLVWAFHAGALKERWLPAVVLEMHADASCVVATFTKNRDVFTAKLSHVEDFCKNFNRRMNRATLDDPEERSSYRFMIEQSVLLAQEAIGGAESERNMWLQWAQENLPAKRSIGLTNLQWADIVDRTKKNLEALKRREIFGSKKRARSTTPCGTEKVEAAIVQNRAVSTPPVDSQPAVLNRADEQHPVSDMDQLVTGLKKEQQSTTGVTPLKKKRKHVDDREQQQTSSAPPSKAKKSMTPSGTVPSMHKAKKSLPSAAAPAAAAQSSNYFKPSYPSFTPPMEKKSTPMKKSTSSGGRGRRGGGGAGDVEALKEPMDRGWVREIVVRKTGEKRACDVYYRLPLTLKYKAGKARSGKEVDSILNQFPHHEACVGLQAHYHFSFNGTLMTAHDREVLHAAGDKIDTRQLQCQ